MMTTHSTAIVAPAAAHLPFIHPADRNSGKTLWLMDALAPFSGQDEVIKEIRKKVFPGKRIKTLQPAPDGSEMAVVEW